MFGKKIKKRIDIEGMMCNHCTSKVENALKSIDGVTKVKVSLNDGCAVIYSKNEIDNKIIEEKISSTSKKVTKVEEI